MTAANLVGMRPFVIAVLLFATRVAMAEPGLDALLAPPGMSPPIPPAPTATEDLKDPHVALLLAALGSAASVAIVGAAARDHGHHFAAFAALSVSSVLILPSAGHFYSGRFFTAGMLTRSIGISIAAAGVMVLIGSEGDTGGTALLAGLIVSAGGAVVDLATAPHEAEAYNDAHRVRVKPVAMHFKTGGYGVGLGGAF